MNTKNVDEVEEFVLQETERIIRGIDVSIYWPERYRNMMLCYVYTELSNFLTTFIKEDSKTLADLLHNGDTHDGMSLAERMNAFERDSELTRKNELIDIERRKRYDHARETQPTIIRSDKIRTDILNSANQRPSLSVLIRNEQCVNILVEQEEKRQ